mmetsp:Transcript_123696/g.395781  ORF Transcript_123696/g.395781 Transcript_123696/m.395781 type:complete len:2282 (-) Transcript_123696:2769-9614(-)
MSLHPRCPDACFVRRPSLAGHDRCGNARLPVTLRAWDDAARFRRSRAGALANQGAAHADGDGARAPLPLLRASLLLVLCARRQRRRLARIGNLLLRRAMALGREPAPTATGRDRQRRLRVQRGKGSGSGNGKGSGKENGTAEQIWPSFSSMTAGDTGDLIREKRAGTAFSRNVLNGIFVPRQVKYDSDFFLRQDADVVASVALFLREAWPESGFYVAERTRRLLESFCELHVGGSVPTDTEIHDSLGQLPVGGSWAVWIKAQNAMLFVERLSSDSAFVGAWRVQQSTEDAMHEFLLMESIPNVARTIPWARLQDIGFAQRVADLSAIPLRETFVLIEKGAQESSEVHETRQPNSPCVVLDWLLPALGGARSDLSLEGEAVAKQVVDDVRLFNNAPWRRPPVWLAIEALVSLDCVRVHGVNQGAVLHKALLLRLMGEALLRGGRAFGDASARVEACRKVAGCVQELDHLDHEAPCAAAAAAKEHACAAVDHVMASVESRWHERSTCEIPSVVPCDRLDFAASTVHRLESSWGRLTALASAGGVGGSEASREAVQVPACRPRVPAFSDQPRPTVLEEHFENLSRGFRGGGPDDLLVALADAERDVGAVWRHWDEHGACPVPEGSLVEHAVPLLELYSTLGGELYLEDPVGQSRRVLTGLALTLLVDRAACERHPLLRQHPVRDLDLDLLQPLLLPYAEQKQTLCDLEQYLADRQSEGFVGFCTTGAASFPNSFGVRFARRCPEMTRVLEEITLQDDSNAERHLADVTRKKEEHQELLQRASRLQHTYADARDKAGNVKTVHDKGCVRCKIEREARAVRVTFYERMLPKAFDTQKRADMLKKGLPHRRSEPWAVVYELLMPELLCAQRSALCVLAREILCKETYAEATGGMAKDGWGGIYGLWRQNPRLRKWIREDSPTTSRLLRHCALASGTKPLESSHYIRDPVHISGHESFVVDCNSSVDLFDNLARRPSDRPWQPDISKVCRIITEDERYQGVQFAIESCAFDENAAIARRAEAHTGLSMQEWMAFESLRAGPRLQLPRLLLALTQRTLSFHRLGVLDVLEAVTSQVGPRRCATEAEGRWRRAAHAVLENAEFCQDVCEHARELLESARENWDRHLVLMSVIQIGVCVWENSVEKTAAERLLLACREVAGYWIRQLGETILACTDEGTVRALHAKLADVAAMGALTFGDAEALIGGTVHVEEWLNFRNVLHDNYLPDDATDVGAPAGDAGGARGGGGGGGLAGEPAPSEGWRRRLFARAAHAALRVEQRLKTLVCCSGEPLCAFVRSRWGDAASGTLGPWALYEAPADKWAYATFTKSGSSEICILQVDISGGTFLVDGAPSGRLPQDITSHDDYRRLFGSTTFDVSPALGGGYVTRTSLNGATFRFWHVHTERQSKALRISESRAGQDAVKTATLVSHSCFTGDLPDALIEDYSHWLMDGPEGPDVFFRPKRYDHELFGGGYIVEASSFILSLSSREVIQTAKYPHSKLIDIRSPTFTAMYTGVFSRLAPFSQVHAYYNAAEDVGGCEIVLPRLQGLHFDVSTGRRGEGEGAGEVRRRNAVVKCRELQAEVLENQQLGTLVGLCHGLLLQDASGQRMLLVPHGTVERRKHKHDTTVIDIRKLRTPSLFTFRVREDLRDLHGPPDRLAWLYLALLHAKTAAPVPDPFTGRLGSSQSMELLRSGHCAGNLRSSTPGRADGASSESTELQYKTLLEIASISYMREDYHTMEVFHVEGTPGTVGDTRRGMSGDEGLCAHDGYAFLVQAMLDEMAEAEALAGETRPKELDVEIAKTMEMRTTSFCKRAYLRDRNLYGRDGRLSFEEETRIFGAGWLTQRMSAEFVVEGDEGLRNDAQARVGKVAAPFFEWAANHDVGRPGNPALTDLLIGASGAAGVTKQRWHEAPTNLWAETSFLDAWLDFYEVARKEGSCAALGLCLSYFAYRDARLVPYLQKLALVAQHSEAFARVDPPEHIHYSSPTLIDFDAETITGLLTAAFEEQKAEPELLRQAPKVVNPYRVTPEATARQRSVNLRKDLQAEIVHSGLLEDLRAAFREGKSVTEKMLLRRIQDSAVMLRSPSDVAQQVNSHFQAWYASSDLHAFLAHVESVLAHVPGGTEEDPWEGGDVDVDVEEMDGPGLPPGLEPSKVDTLRLQMHIPKEISLSAFEERLADGHFDGAVSHSAALEESADHTEEEAAELSELPVLPDGQFPEIERELLAPLQESWKLAHKTASKRPRAAAAAAGGRRSTSAAWGRRSWRTRRTSSPTRTRPRRCCRLWPRPSPR